MVEAVDHPCLHCYTDEVGPDFGNSDSLSSGNHAMTDVDEMADAVEYGCTYIK
jgi:hypothetical protein